MFRADAVLPRQLTLPGFEAQLQPPGHRVFFAVMPDADSAAQIALRAEHLRASGRLRGKRIKTQRLHVTLHHLGDFPELPVPVVTAARAAADSIAAAPFDVTFDHAMSFAGRPGNRPFVLLGEDGLAALTAFWQVLGDALARAGLHVTRAHFKPHMTLLYDRSAVARQSVEPIGWTVREFVLIHSLLGKTHYETLGRWPLTGPGTRG